MPATRPSYTSGRKGLQTNSHDGALWSLFWVGFVRFGLVSTRLGLLEQISVASSYCGPNIRPRGEGLLGRWAAPHEQPLQSSLTIPEIWTYVARHGWVKVFAVHRGLERQAGHQPSEGRLEANENNTMLSKESVVEMEASFSGGSISQVALGTTVHLVHMSGQGKGVEIESIGPPPSLSYQGLQLI
ncbi:hypothetical protein MKZ38_010139 [Zalerion maritima]|uniref:Uncharacterized protein n=1 Tax=Zalerion maritima TaxID=339359 RepID=A0AAD5RJP3_9PEZI|nr:hypothetical protein MKZ38_010139 [Zalerion maritima]